MKNFFSFILSCMLFLPATRIPAIQPPAKLSGHITLSGAFALYPLAVKWAEEFRKIHPEVQIDISAGGAGKGMTDVINNMVDIGMVSREIYPVETKKGAFAFSMAKDAVVAVMNSANPQIQKILQTGLTRDAAISLWITGKYKSWGQVVKSSAREPVHLYTRSDACGAAEIWAKYLGKKQEDLNGSGVYGDPGLALAVKKDPVGIGFNNIGYAYDAKTKKMTAGIRVIPLDLNNNGKVDPDENFYDSMDKIMEAIGKGKYPSPPSRELFFVTKGKVKNQLVKEFIKWALTDGQKYVNQAGYIRLPEDKIKNELKKLDL